MSDGMTPEEKAWCKDRGATSTSFQGVTSKGDKPLTVDDLVEARETAAQIRMRRTIAQSENGFPYKG